MLIVLLMFALIRSLRGVPLGAPSEPPDPFPALALRDAQSHFGQRTVNDIVISCLATIFACTWSAIHPNIPAVTDSKWTCFKRQVTITIYALLAPELVTLWAMEQRVAAKKIMDKYNKDINGVTHDSGQNSILEKFKAISDAICGVFQDSPLPPPLKKGKGPQWTLAHGFFLQMGGFMLSESGRPIQTLLDDFWWHTDETTLIWNIQQKVIDPPRITEEDIQDRSKGDTISKTFIILQTTWFVVQCIARWSQHLPVTELEIVTLGFAMLNGITYIAWWDKPQNVGRPVFLECTSSLLGQASEPRKESWLRRKLRQEIEEHGHSPRLLWHLPLRILHALLRPLVKMFFEDHSATKMRVGMFYTAQNAGVGPAYITFASGALFGSVHLIPSWYLHFSSHQEMWLWRVSAIIITAEPILYKIAENFYSDYHGLDPRPPLFYLVVFGSFLADIGAIVYPFARIVLLTLSLTALRSLPSGALQTIEWTTFIPHL